MPHDTTLLATIAAGLGLAFVLRLRRRTRLRLPPLVGYLLAGVAVGPFTPGFVADAALASQLAEIGVILLMFGVGPALLARRPARGAAHRAARRGGADRGRHRARRRRRAALGLALGAGLVFGLSLSVASTVVLLRALEERGVLDSVDGRIAVGWLIVEDLVMVLVLVLLPALAGVLGGAPGVAGRPAEPRRHSWLALGLTLGKVAAFVALMLVVGRAGGAVAARRASPGPARASCSRSAVLAIALGVAFGAAELFGVSFALGAFFAGRGRQRVGPEPPGGRRRARRSRTPSRCSSSSRWACCSIPRSWSAQPLAGARPCSASSCSASRWRRSASCSLFRYPARTALTVSASLAQIGEFSFILAGLGLSLGLLPAEGQSLILAGALLSITLNPVAFAVVGPVSHWLRSRPRLLDLLERPHQNPPLDSSEDRRLRNHAIVVGFGRVGGTVGEALERCGIPYVAIERDRRIVEAIRARGVPALSGDATRPGILPLAHPERARLLVVATPDPYQARETIRLARQANPKIDIVVRTHNAAEERYLGALGVGRAVMGELELALGMAHYALIALGRSDDDADGAVAKLRESARIAAQVR